MHGLRSKIHDFANFLPLPTRFSREPLHLVHFCLDHFLRLGGLQIPSKAHRATLHTRRERRQKPSAKIFPYRPPPDPFPKVLRRGFSSGIERLGPLAFLSIPTDLDKEQVYVFGPLKSAHFFSSIPSTSPVPPPPVDPPPRDLEGRPPTPGCSPARKLADCYPWGT
jgi:hypothetical protein